MFALFAAAALSQTPAARTVEIVDAAFTGNPTELAVLGTAHLVEFDQRFSRARLAPLIDRLAAWRPAVITVEAGTGRACDAAAARPDLHGPEPNAYCKVAATARLALKLDQARAEIEITARLAESPKTSADRRRLATLFLAAGEPGSALVQWLRLPPSERLAGDSLTPGLAAALGRYTASPNEDYSLAAPLAARVGIERLHPIEDYEGGTLVTPLGKPYVERLAALWNNPAAKTAAAARDRANDAFLNGGDVLAFYRRVNAPDTLAGQMRADFAAAIADRSAEATGRRYLAYWETRNLRMVSNIRLASGDRPGARVLSLVGSSHKPYFERYFATQSDVRIVDVGELLR